MENKLKIDSKIIDFDGHSARLIIEDKDAFLENLKKKQSEILKDLNKEIVDIDEINE